MIPVIRLAIEVNVSFTLDMESYYFKDLTIAVFQSLFDDIPDLPFAGLVLQAYLPETRSDLLSLLKWAKKSKSNRYPPCQRRILGLQTVINEQKGWPIPVFLNKEETDHNYEEFTRVLLENTDLIRTSNRHTQCSEYKPCNGCSHVFGPTNECVGIPDDIRNG